jgi:hypothetical protein
LKQRSHWIEFQNRSCQDEGRHDSVESEAVLIIATLHETGGRHGWNMLEVHK